MKLINQIFFASVILSSMQLNGMETLRSLFQSTTDFAKQYFSAPQKGGSPEEYKFMRQLEQWTVNDRQFAIFNLVMRESLKPASPFIKSLIKIVSSNIQSIATSMGHDNWVSSVSWSPDGRYALSGSLDDTIKLWDLRDKQNPKEIPASMGHDRAVESVSWSPDSNYAISGSWDKTLKLWDLTNKQNPIEIKTLSGHDGPVRSVSWSPDGNYALSGSSDNTIKLWDLRDKQNPNIKAIATLMGHNDSVRSVSWSPDSNYAISGSEDKKIKLWDLTNKQYPKEIPALMGHDGTVFSVSWSPDGNYAISSSVDGAIKFWDLSFINLPKQLMKLVDSRDGVIQYLLLSSILDFRKNQQDKTHKLYTRSPKPFKITYPKLKKIFNELPEVLVRELISKKYVFVTT